MSNSPLWEHIGCRRGTVLITWSVLLAFASGGWSADAPAQDTPQPVELKGRVVCLPEEMQRRYQVELPTTHEHVFGFRTEAGDYYTLLRTKASEALFADPRLREKDLLLKGRVFPGSRVLEVTGTLRSIKDGVICELYYFCDICVIKTISPEPCLCCQAPVELMEVDHSKIPP